MAYAADETNHRLEKKLSVKRLGDDICGYQPGSKASCAMGYLDENFPAHFPWTGKLIALRDILKEWHSKAPDDKIIIFTQFVQCARIIGRLLHMDQYQFAYYFGGLSGDARRKALEIFHERDDVKILVASLKCGGQALNITCANRVVLLEPWWNTAVEKQAFGRVHRMGQTKEMEMKRFVVEGSFEENIAHIQSEKDEEISQCLLDDKLFSEEITLDCILKYIGQPIRRNGKIVGIMSKSNLEEEADAKDEEANIKDEEKDSMEGIEK
jgi:SNF2 family DNA or RNA helicase